MANFCPNCGQPRETPQPQSAPTQTQAGPMYPAQYPPQQSGPSAGKLLAWVFGVLGLLIGIPIALVLLLVLFRLLGIF